MRKYAKRYHVQYEIQHFTILRVQYLKKKQKKTLNTEPNSQDGNLHCSIIYSCTYCAYLLLSRKQLPKLGYTFYSISHSSNVPVV